MESVTAAEAVEKLKSEIYGPDMARYAALNLGFWELKLKDDELVHAFVDRTKQMARRIKGLSERDIALAIMKGVSHIKEYDDSRATLMTMDNLTVKIVKTTLSVRQDIINASKANAKHVTLDTSEGAALYTSGMHDQVRGRGRPSFGRGGYNNRGAPRGHGGIQKRGGYGRGGGYIDRGRGYGNRGREYGNRGREYGSRGRGPNYDGGYESRGGSRIQGRGHQQYHASSERCYNCGGSNHKRHECKKPCQTCSSYEHFTYECPNYAEKGHANATLTAPEEERGQAFSASFIPSDNLPPHLRQQQQNQQGTQGAAHATTYYTSKYPHHEWILDSGATHHMAPYLDLLHDYHDVRGSVEVANGVYIPRPGKGTIHVEATIDGKVSHMSIANVWYVPQLTRGLLSVPALSISGCKYYNNDDLSCTILNQDRVPILNCPLVNGLFRPNWTLIPAIGEAHASHAVRKTKQEDAKLWHERLGHLSYQKIAEMVKQNLVTGINVPASEFLKEAQNVCDVCTMAKMNRAPFKSQPKSVVKPLQVVHADLIEMEVTSIGGSKWALTIIDDYTDYANVIPIKHKDDAMFHLMKTMNEWETMTRFKVETFFTDRGGEFLNAEMQQFCAEKGIIHNKSTPRNHQQNGKAENTNRRFGDLVRSLLTQYALPKKLWAEAISYASHLHNVSMKKRLHMTPQQAFVGTIPDITSLRTFGCKVFSRVSDEVRQKLDPKSQLGMYMGPSKDGPGCRVLLWKSNLKYPKYAVVHARDVVAVESLKDCTGAQKSCEIQWGGDIPCPGSGQRMPENGSGQRMPENGSGQRMPENGLNTSDSQDGSSRRMLELRSGRSMPEVGLYPASGSAPLQVIPREQGRTLTEQPQTVSRIAQSLSEPPLNSLTCERNGEVPHNEEQQIAVATHLGQRADAHGCPRADSSSQPTTQNSDTVMQQAEPAEAVDPEPVIDATVLPPPPALPLPPPSLPQVDVEVIAEVAADENDTVDPEESGRYPKRARRATVRFQDDPKHFHVRKGTLSAKLHATPEGHANVAFMEHDEDFATIEIVDKDEVPITYDEAMSCQHASAWLDSIADEYNSLITNGTWELVDREKWMRVIPCKWVFKIKTDENGNPVRFKSRLVAGGHRQIYGEDHFETFAPVSRYVTLKILLSIAAHRDWTVLQIDVTTAFLHGLVDADVYMTQPEGFTDGSDKVCRLIKCLYGLKQAPRAWYLTLSELLKELGFKKCSSDTSLWVKEMKMGKVYIVSVVDDMLIMSPEETVTRLIANKILERFPGTPPSKANWYVGMKLTWLPEEHAVVLTQAAHIQDILKTYEGKHENWNPKKLPMQEGMKLCKSGSKDNPESPPLDTVKYPYRSLVGAMNYLACTTRPDIAQTINKLSKYLNDPTEVHWLTAINLLKYLKGTMNVGIKLGHGGGLPDVVGYCDADYGTNLEDTRSTSGYVFLVHGGPVTWKSNTQDRTALSTTDAEFRAMSVASMEALWLRKILPLFDIECKPLEIRGDSQSAIAAVNKDTETPKTRHIDAKHQNFMREARIENELSFVHIPGSENMADVLTKPLGGVKHKKCCDSLGLVNQR